MKKINPNILIFYYLPPIVWMMIIFYMSSLPHFAIVENTFYDFIIFKILHMIEFGFLYFLLFRAFAVNKFPSSKKLLYPFIIAVFYAVTDEIHQTLVPTREGRIRDIFIDTAGIWIVYMFIKKIKWKGF